MTRTAPRRASAALVAALLTFAALVATATDPAWAADPPQPLASADTTITAVRVPVGPQVGSWRTDPVWGQAQLAEGFLQAEPIEGAPASERTEVRVVFDDEAIYIGAWLYDTEPDRLLVGERRRDAALSGSDAFVVVLDTYRDQQNGFAFGTTPSGIQYDGQVVSEGRGGGGGGGGGRGRAQGGAGGGFNVNWDGNWSVTTESDEDGWYAFFRIPFSTLRYGAAPEQTWGINFARFIGRKNEQVYWSPIERQYDLYRLSDAGTLTAVEVPARRILTFTPYGLASAQRVPATHEGVRYPLEFGADAKVGITAGLTMDLTANTDFAQVEVDEQQLDITRFSLLFPEKRPFFLENAGRFAVGDNRSAQMFFSRRIGISDSGAPVPIEWGTRASGRVAGMDVGLLHIRTDELEGVQPDNSYSVARISRELPNRSSLGAIVTNRDSDIDGDWGRTYAVDGNLGIGESFNLASTFGMTDAPGYSDGREAIVLTSGFVTGTWRLSSYYDQIGANFDPEVGFLRRSDFRQVGGTVSYSYRAPSIPWLREIRPHVNYESSYTLAGFKETESVHADVAVVWQNGAQFTPEPNYVYDGLETPFRVAPGIEVQPGEYSGWFFAPRFNTSTQKPLVFRTGAYLGRFLSGTRTGGFGTVEFRQGATLAGEATVDHSEFDLAEGTFSTTLARTRIGYSFSPNLFIQSLVQYSTQNEIWSGNVRLGWIDEAGTGLFLVYNERQREDGFPDPLERTLILKFSRQLDLGDQFGL